MKLRFGAGLISLTVVTHLMTAASSIAGPFSSGNNLVVVRLGEGSPFTFGTAQSVHLDEYNVSGASAAFVQSVDLPSGGASSATLSSETGNHDGLLNRSVDGRFLVLGAYRASVGANDPTLDPAGTTPRVIVRVGASGAVDTSTALVDAYSTSAFRSVATVGGSSFWVAGDNAGGIVPESITGGLRYVSTLGATTSVNLSQKQVSGPLPTPDNVRGIGIFDGQLFDSSGSSSSIGKAVFQVGTGLPTSGSQTLTTLTTDGASTNAFVFLDLNAAVPGIDTLYTSASAVGIGLRKYSLVSGTWNFNGFIPMPGIEAMTAAASGSTVTVYASDGNTVNRLTDSTGYNAAIAGTFAPILTASANQSFRGLAFAPMSAALPGDYNGDHVVNAADYTVWRNTLHQSVPFGTGADGDYSGKIEAEDYFIWKNNYAPQMGVGATASDYAVPEPASAALAFVMMLGGLVLRLRVCNVPPTHLL